MNNEFTEEFQAHLIRRLQEGNPSSLELIFNDLFPGMHLQATQLTGSREAAEEIAANAFLKIWGRRGRFTHYKVLKSYLYITVRNECFDYLAKSKKQKRSAAALEERYSGREDKNALEQMIASENQEALKKSLEALAPQCRRILEMIFLEGKKCREVAQQLGLAKETVKTHKSRGLLKLKRLLSR